MKKEIKRYYAYNGHIRIESPLVNGMIHGLRIFWISKGQVLYKTTYKIDLECGAKIEFKY